MSDYKLKGSINKTAFIMDKIPPARHDYLYLLISYWQIFDGIEIPEEVVKQIVERGTQPETISRSRRKVLEQARFKQFLELQRMAKELEVKEEAPIKREELLNVRKPNSKPSVLKQKPRVQDKR
jgi:hypothetical protein